MLTHAIEILLVEDNPSDAELTVHSLKKENLANRVELIGDGAEALDLLFRRGAYAARTADALPKVVLLDLKLPKSTAWRCCARSRLTPARAIYR